MTLTAESTTTASRPDARHPLDSLGERDITRAKEVLVTAGILTETVRIAYLGVLEPHKNDVLALESGATLDRRIRAILVEISAGVSTDVTLSVDTGEVLTNVTLDGSAGRAPILHSEYEHVDAIVSSDPQWIAALAKRGLLPTQVRAVALSAGDFGLPGEEGRRPLRIVPFMRDTEVESVWAHPIGGLCAYFDATTNEIYEMVDHRVYPVPAESGDYDSADVAGPALTGLKPISITQPEGPSFQVDGEVITWANWSMRVGYDHREGLIIREVSYDDFGTVRPILYRGSIAEMVVPYADPAPSRFWLNYFDAGEFVFGRYGNSLELGCDCVGEIRYLDATLSDEFGNPTVIKNAICIHEEDMGVLWKHSDDKLNHKSVRRNRRLVVSFFTTVGNYDYGFFWYFYLDGTIECETKLTGLLLQAPYPEEGSDYQNEVAPGLGAPYHQHLFSARLDMMVDGVQNAVDEVDARRVTIGPGNEYGNAFGLSSTRLRSESEGARGADASVGRAWHVVNTEKTNRTGRPTGYMLYPQQAPTLLADTASSIHARATFATKQLWVTRYSPDERYPAGEYVNQNPGGDGLPLYTRADRDIDGQDIVLWHTFGPTHFPRIEDWPVMPVDTAKFMLKPYGFFDKNPSLNVPAESAHCLHHPSGDCTC